MFHVEHVMNVNKMCIESRNKNRLINNKSVYLLIN